VPIDSAPLICASIQSLFGRVLAKSELRQCKLPAVDKAHLALCTRVFACRRLLKSQLQAELEGTRPTHLIERTQDAEALRERLSSLSKGTSRLGGTEC